MHFYTKVLKFSGSQNIIISGLAGAIPPLLGWTAVVFHRSITTFTCAINFYLTPPHFWALAINKRRICKSWHSDDACGQRYQYTKIQIVLCSILLMAVSLLICNWIFWLCLSDWSSNSWRNIHKNLGN